MSQHQIALFTFTLGNTESISPVALRDLWVRAAGIGNVSVGRKSPHGSYRDRPTYMLYAPQSLGNLRVAMAASRAGFGAGTAGRRDQKRSPTGR